MAAIVGGPGSTSGQSELLGVVLLFGLVLTVTVTVVVVGGDALDGVKADTTMESAETTMLELQSAMQSVAATGGTAEAVTFADITGARPAADAASGAGASGGGGTVRVDETAGEITVAVTDASEGRTETVSRPLGAVIYEQDGGRVAYQAGGVFRQSTGSESSSVVSPPNVQYQYRNGNPTLSLPLTRVTVPGPATTATPDEEVKLTPAGGRSRHLPSPALSNPLDRGDTVTLTIDSEYYRAWGTHFAQRTGGTVSYDRANGEVTVAFGGSPQRPASVDSSAVFAASAKITNQGRVDSYDSTVAGYGGWWDRENGDVKIDGVGKLDSNEDPQIHGDYTATGHGEFANGPDVYGETVLGGAGEQTYVRNDADFHGPFSTKGELSVEAGSHLLGGDVRVGEDLTTFRDVTATGDVHVGGSVVSSNYFYNATVEGDVLVGGSFDGPHSSGVGATIEGSLSAADTVRVGDPIAVEGEAISAGNRVVITDGTYHVDVRSKGDVVIQSGATVVGNVEANGDVTVDGTVEATTGGDGGNVDAGGTISGEGNVDGATNEHVSPAPVNGLRYEDREEPKTPSVPTLESQKDLIQEKRTTLSVNDENDNDDHSATIDAIENGNCDAGCTLPAGKYALDRIDVGNGDSLTLDAAGGGAVELYVENDVRITDRVTVTEDTNVHVYANEDFRMDHQDAEISIPNDDATQFWVYTMPDSEAEFVKATFTGVLYGPGTDTESATAVTITNSVTINGAVIADPPAPISADVSIHYDEALQGVRPGPPDPPISSEVAFLQFSTRPVALGE